LLPGVAPPLLSMTAMMALLAWVALVRSHRGPAPPVDREPPSTLKSAVVFGLLYAVVLVSVAAVRQHFSEGALYAVAALSGLTDVDAITLSTARVIDSGRLGTETGWRVILVGALANLAFKAGIVATAGGARLARATLPLFGLACLGGLLLLVLWPATSL
jgi:uncharacterized membrane protein (DUF4010 family)